MNLLLVGGGKAGSWQIRGVQMGAALGARVTSSPTRADAVWADRIIVVKRALAEWGPRLRDWSYAPLVWDALDFWSQPGQNSLTVAEGIALARTAMRATEPDLVIGATQAMASDMGGVYLPHHARPGLVPRPVRETVQVVAYEGAPAYLGRWDGWLRGLCVARGWSFAVNPSDLADADIVVSVRDGIWDGPLCQSWKSGVKLVNALAVGRPVIGQASAALGEIGPGGYAVADADEAGAALDALADVRVRAQIARDSLEQVEAYRLETVAARYRHALEALPCLA